jgi:NhaP-type Na+/H+ or K+/H+ antiporter
MVELLHTQLRAWVRRWLGDRSGQAELLVVLLLAFLIWVLATNRRVVIQ